MVVRPARGRRPARTTVDRGLEHSSELRSSGDRGPRRCRGPRTRVDRTSKLPRWPRASIDRASRKKPRRPTDRRLCYGHMRPCPIEDRSRSRGPSRTAIDHRFGSLAVQGPTIEGRLKARAPSPKPNESHSCLKGILRRSVVEVARPILPPWRWRGLTSSTAARLERNVFAP